MKREFQKGDGTTSRFAYTVREPFGPWEGDPWQKYIEWSGLTQLTEILTGGAHCQILVSLDCDEDWHHNVNEDFHLDLFWDLDYLRQKIPEGREYNLLAIARNPAENPSNWQPQPNFNYAGCDLVDPMTGVSALTYCRGFPDAFNNSEISPLGLIPDWHRAVELQSALAKAYPEEPHAQCDVWTIWRHAPARSSNSGDN